MYVTHLPWCDFAVWSPAQEPFIQRVKYDASFMTTALERARKFYFSKFLSSVFLPSDSHYFIITILPLFQQENLIANLTF